MDKFETIENLVKAGFDVNFPLSEHFGHRPLHIAAKDGSKAMILKLIELGAEVDGHNDDNVNALMWAAYDGRFENVEILLEKGANPNVIGTMYPYQCDCCPEEYTPLLAAFDSNNTQIIIKLLHAGADSNMPLHCNVLQKGVNQDSKELILELIQHGADVISIDCCNNTPLMRPAYLGQIEIVILLLEKGADPKAGSGIDLSRVESEEIRNLLKKYE